MRCAVGSWGGRGPSPVRYVTVTGRKDGPPPPEGVHVVYPLLPVGDERAVLALSSTALLCFISLCSCFSMGAFSPLLPEIGRAGALADWQLGVVAGALGFARMATAIPAGWLAGRYLGTTLCASPALMLAGTVLLATSPSFPVLVLGRLILGFAYTLGTVSGLIALLLEDRGPGASVRLNVFEFSAMIGVLGGLGLVGLLPDHWGWSLSLLIASSPLLLILAAVPSIRRRFPTRRWRRRPRHGHRTPAARIGCRSRSGRCSRWASSSPWRGPR